jgi:HEAT repeat protein
MPRFRALLAPVVLASAAAPALAHGGSYKPPGPTGGIPPDSEILNPRLPVPTPPDRREMTPWERWWNVNQDRIVGLRKRLRARDGGDVATKEEEDPFFGSDADRPKASVEGPAVTREFLEREVLPAVTQALRDQDPEVRSAAALALGKMGFPRSFMDLKRALDDPEKDVREAAILGLGMAGERMATESLRALLLDPNVEERFRGAAGVALGFLGGADAGDALVAYLDPATDATRVGGIRRRPSTECCVLAALGLARHAPAAPFLREAALGSREADGSKAQPAVQSFGLVALAKTGDRTTIPVGAMLSLLADDREVRRQGAALALGLVAKPDEAAVTKALAVAAIGDRDLGVRSLATMALARIGGDPAKKALREVLDKAGPVDLPFASLGVAVAGDKVSAPLLRLKFRESRDPSARGALAISLALLGDAEIAPDLRREAFGKGDRVLRRHCMTALGLLGDQASAEELRRIVSEDWDPWLKIGAGVALGLLQDRRTIPLLGVVAKSATSIHARGHACRILGMVGNRDAAKILLGFVRDPKEQPFVRMFAVTGLGILGERGDVPILSTIGADTDPEIRVDALDAIADLM